MSRWLCLCVLAAIVMAGCHAVYPFDVDKDSGPPDAASVELDGPRTEAGIPPDTVPWPTWDFGGTMCNKLMAWGPPVQVSAPDTKPARAPSIVGIGDTFYVAFVEGKEAYVREVKATAHEPPSHL